MEQIWTIRLTKKPNKYLTHYEPHMIHWGGFKDAKSFQSKYKSKQMRALIGLNTACELYKWEWGL